MRRVNEWLKKGAVLKTTHVNEGGVEWYAALYCKDGKLIEQGFGGTKQEARLAVEFELTEFEHDGYESWV